MVRISTDRMTSNRILVVIISTWISAYSQSFTEGPGNHHILLGGNATLVWNITVESGTFSSGVWSNNRDSNVMVKFGTDDSEVLQDYRTKIVPFGQYGMTVLDIEKEDSGKYTATLNCFGAEGQPVLLVQGGFINHYDVLLPLEVNMSLNKPLRNGSEVMIGQDVNVTVQAPPNDPAAINISIAVSNVNGFHTAEDCTNRNETTPCIYNFKVAQLGLIQIEACLKHPAVSIQPCEKVFLTGQEIDPQEDKCKWWCILIIVLVVVSVVVIIIIICCCCWHYKVACFAHKLRCKQFRRALRLT